jgi:putative oxidoreductase
VALFRSLLPTIAPTAYAALRIAAGLLFMAHGLQKLFGLLGGRQADLLSRMGAAGVIETIGGALIAVGLFTTPVALLASAEMAIAYFLSHFPNGRWPIQNGGELAVLYCFAFLSVAAHGAGIWSADAVRHHLERP